MADSEKQKTGCWGR